MIIQPWHWLVLGVVLLILEMFVPTFALLWFGTAAIVVALLSWLLPLSVSWQVIIWLVVSVVLVVLWFKYIKPMAKDRTKAGLGGSAFIGEVGMIIVSPQQNGKGVIRFSVPLLGSDEWECQSEQPLAVGDRAKIVNIAGNTLVVAPTTST